MGDRHEHNPSRDNRDEDQREFYKAMVIGQERIAQALQTLTTRVEHMNAQDRRNQEQEHDNRSVASSQGAPRHRSWTVDRPTTEWRALPPHVHEMLNFDHYLSQRR